MAQCDPALRLYAILDESSCARRRLDPLEVAAAWRDAGVGLLQYRNKTAPLTGVVQRALEIRKIFRGQDCFLLLNDYPALVHESGFDGVHCGQDDGDIEEIRAIVGTDAILGISTHSPAQAQAADRMDIDYVAIGPVFPTGSKPNAEPVVGLCSVSASKALCRRPLVAIGGIDLAQAAAVRLAGADAVAVISGLLPAGPGTLTETARDFLAAFQ